MKRYNLILFLAALVLFSCEDDKDEMNDIPATGNPVGILENAHASGQTVTADFAGRITNKQGTPIAGASVSAGGSVAFTNPQGFYQIEDAAVDDNYALIKVEYNGMFDQYRALKPRTNQTNYADIAMIQKVVNGFFSTESGGTIDIAGGSTVSFPAGELVTSGGQPYSGEVLVASTYLDPSDPSLISYMPGSLAAVDDDGEAMGMITYGMVGVELTAASNGQSLQLAGGRTATLTMPLPESHSAHAPESIPLWFFDETAGIWQEEGVATRSGNSYVGQVSHFTFWNCDVSINTIFLEGQVSLQPLDFPFSGVRAKLTRPDGSSALSPIDPEGAFSGIVPADETLLLEVIANECEAVLYSAMIGPFSDDTDLGGIQVENSESDFTIIDFFGTIVDCDGNPIEDAFVSYEEFGGSISGYLLTDEAGFYATSIPCLSAGELSFSPLVLSEFLQGEDFEVSYNIEEASVYDNGEYAFCQGDTVVEYLTYFDGTNILHFDRVDFEPMEELSCGNLIVSLEGQESTNFVDGITLFNNPMFPESAWGSCNQDVEVRGHLSSGQYLVAELFWTIGNTHNIIQLVEDGESTLLIEELSYFNSINGAVQVNIFVDEFSSTPIDSYTPDEVNLEFLLYHTE